MQQQTPGDRGTSRFHGKELHALVSADRAGHVAATARRDRSFDGKEMAVDDLHPRKMASDTDRDGLRVKHDLFISTFSLDWINERK